MLHWVDRLADNMERSTTTITLESGRIPDEQDILLCEGEGMIYLQGHVIRGYYNPFDGILTDAVNHEKGAEVRCVLNTFSMALM